MALWRASVPDRTCSYVYVEADTIKRAVIVLEVMGYERVTDLVMEVDEPVLRDPRLGEFSVRSRGETKQS